MAIKNLRCIRENDSIAVIWVWDTNQEYAWITVTRLPDGAEVASLEVEQAFFRQAVNSPRHGPVLSVPPVPLRVTVKDGDNEESFDLIDKNYTVYWRIKKHNVYQRRGFFGGQKLDRTDVRLQLTVPYDAPIPGDLFCCVLNGAGEQPKGYVPGGYLPGLNPGLNEYGVILAAGQSIQLYCNPNRQEISRLFVVKRLPDEEQ